MSRLIRLLTAAALVATSAPLNAQPVPFGAREILLARAESIDLSETLVAFIAERAEPTRLGAQAFALETESSPRSVIQRLCGDVSQAYVDAFVAQNSNPDLDLDAPLSIEEGTALTWPACVPRAQSFEGALAAVNAELVPREDVGAFTTELKDVLTNEGIFDQLTFGRSTQPPGQIVTALPDGQAACGSEPSQIFDVARVTAAYRYSDPRQDRYVPPARIWVIDNGIYGSNPDDPTAFGPAIPRRFFATIGNVQVGPTVGTNIHPSNYANRVLPVTPVSGHGTHVAGLTLGGPPLLDDRSILMRDRHPWLTLWIVNIGRGQRNLITNSQQNVVGTLAVGRNDIVNMSIAYVWPDDDNLQNGLRLEIQSRSQTLFVVAAGNRVVSGPLPSAAPRTGVDVANAGIYPAAFGGIGGGTPANLITVGAHDQNGDLATFSNHGMNVDLLAPGCNVASWLADGAAPVPLSGTSQATPIVSFTAALLLSLDDQISPYGIKARLFSSGDLLDPDQWDRVASRSRLNIPRALFVFDDYVRTADGAEYLGRIRDITGLRCPGDSGPRAFTTMLGFNRADDGTLWLYTGRTSGLSACMAEASDARVRFEPTHRLDASGTPQPLLEPIEAFGFDQIVQVVRRTNEPGPVAEG